MSLLVILPTICRTESISRPTDPEKCHFSEVSGHSCSQLPPGLSLPHPSHDSIEESPLCSGLLCKLSKAGDESASEGGPNRDTAHTGFSLSLNRACRKLQVHKGSTYALPSWAPLCACVLSLDTKHNNGTGSPM